MDLSALQSRLARAAGVRVACVGDVMVDRTVEGEVARVSPEAPIPVLAHRSQTEAPGAAANVARNAAALGASAVLVGLRGELAAPASPGVEDRLVRAPGRPTTVKTRFTAAGQQLLRLDHEETGPPEPDVAAALAQAAGEAAQGAGAVLVSDYAKGAVTGEVMAAVRAAGAPVVVDPKGRSLARYGPVALIKPNVLELSQVLGRPLDGGDDAEVERALHEALDECEADAILLTRAGAGMSLAERGRPVRHLRGRARQVFDVTGAGDTALAALGVALAAGADLVEAMELALLASGVVVGKRGTAVAHPHELVEAELAQRFAPAEGKVATQAEAAAAAARWRAEGLRVGFTNGCFDVLHRGHVSYLAQARAWCDRLVVGLNSDRSVRALKGEGRPVNDLEGRALVLAGLACVDLVAPFDADTPQALIEAVRPDVLVKGADYAEHEVVGADFVKANGGEVRLAPLVEGHSTTATIARMRA
ncbi:MAG: D-glycero-beta-D-manno-heptose 1-phosphate adenylyltransferase [Caulobacteraceae bacterium]|nr:D-glycero-beta-D-manno-heptose 1-phosphate adenylyltransferase [Caulobacter sp.]